jgi:hypothetical protein
LDKRRAKIEKKCLRATKNKGVLKVVSACNGEDFWWSSSAAIFAECMACVAAIEKVEFKHCPRGINVVAHTLARYCFESKNSYNLVDEPPSCIVSKLLDDVIVV